jgi:hypothetical protein
MSLHGSLHELPIRASTAARLARESGLWASSGSLRRLAALEYRAFRAERVFSTVAVVVLGRPVASRGVSVMQIRVSRSGDNGLLECDGQGVITPVHRPAPLHAAIYSARWGRADDTGAP